MKKHVDIRNMVALLVLVLCSGCADAVSVAQVTSAAGSGHVIKAESVGDYRISQSTLKEILGADTPENRKRFADAGLTFEFNQGKELTGVTVSSTEYALENGLTVGSAAVEVRDKLGEPRATKITLKPNGIELDALVYDDFVFLLDGDKKVIAIRIGD